MAKPKALPPIGLTQAQAAGLINVPVPDFMALVRAGEMPPPKRVGKQLLWSRRLVEDAFDALRPAADNDPYCNVRV